MAGVRLSLPGLAALGGALLLLLNGCTEISLKQTVMKVINPSNPADPWIVSLGDLSANLSWAEPADADIGAVEIIGTPTHGTSTKSIQTVVAAGQQTATLTLPSNNAGYTFTIYMVDKAGHVSNTGAATRNSFTLHSLFDRAAQPQGGGGGLPVNVFASQAHITTVSHFQGTGAGTYAGYDTYTYDSTSGLPGTVTSYNGNGATVAKVEYHYATGGIERVLQVASLWNGSAWVLNGFSNTYFDSSSRVTKTELYSNNYGNTPLQLQAYSTYATDASGNLTGWTTYDGSGNVQAKVSYVGLPTLEQWALGNASGVIQQNGLIEADYDSAGRISQLVEYNTSDMSIGARITYAYDSYGNVLKVTVYFSNNGGPLEQQSYDIYGY